MSTYQRNGRSSTSNETPISAQASPTMQAAGSDPKKDGIRVNGLQQVIDLLRAADPEFRESLLRRLAAQDPGLVQKLKRQI